MKHDNYSDFEKDKEKCRFCYIGNIYKRVVLSDGNKINPIVMVIGEAPGNDEVINGIPFVGKAGKLLRKVLNKFGFRKNNAIITNVIPCRPENNKFPQDGKVVNDCMERWLLNEIRLLKPQYLLLIGATPTKYILGLTGITKLRGQWFEFEKIPCMPTYHPSYVLRKEYMEEGKEIMDDFCKDIRSVSRKAGFIL